MRPPIIISNGGIVDELAKGCGNETTDQGVANKIMKNIHYLNRKKNATVAMIIKNKNAHSDTPCLYWRLSSDDQPPMFGPLPKLGLFDLICI